MIPKSSTKFSCTVKPDPDLKSVDVELQFTEEGLQIGDDPFETLTWEQIDIAEKLKRAEVK